MKSMPLLDNVEYHDKNPYAQPVHIDKHERALLFALKPGQSLHERNAPDAPFYIVVMEGAGVFAGGDGRAQEFGAGTLLIFDPGESHSIRALDENLVFLGLMRGTSGNRADDASARRHKRGALF